MSSNLKSPPTSSEVARRAGVSRTTVSFVLNDVRERAVTGFVHPPSVLSR